MRFIGDLFGFHGRFMGLSGDFLGCDDDFIMKYNVFVGFNDKK